MASEEKEKPKFPKRQVVVPKSTSDLQRLHVDALMRDVTKPAKVPEPRKERGPRAAPESVRWVPGSSAGAGSSEFHIYRNLRDHETKRQEWIEKKATQEEKDEEFQRQRNAHLEEGDEKTAKKRGKRQRKKQLQQQAKKLKKLEGGDDGRGAAGRAGSDSDSDSGDGNNEESGPDIVVGGR